MDHIFLLICLKSIFKKEHQTELQTDEQHQIETKARGLQQQIRLRKTRERDILVIAVNQFARHG